jgi:hypothetical protein
MGNDQAGARTSNTQSGSLAFRVLKSDCAMTMSPTHDGATINVE